MSFTDDDLKRLEEDVKSPAFFFNGMDDRLRPLLARLEAAEKLIGADKSDLQWQEWYFVWLKAAGK